MRPDISVTIGTLDARPRAPLQHRAHVGVVPADQGCRENAPNNYFRSRCTFSSATGAQTTHQSPRPLAREPVAHRSSIRPPVTTSRMISVVPITVET